MEAYKKTSMKEVTQKLGIPGCNVKGTVTVLRGCYVRT